MANNTVYPYGTGGQLPSSIGIINDLVTGGSDKALSAEQGKVLNEAFGVREGTEYIFQNSQTTSWSSGNISNNGSFDSYANMRIVISIPQEAKDAGTVKITFGPSTTYSLKICVSTQASSGFVTLQGLSTSSSVQTKDVDVANYNYLAFVLWDKPSLSAARNIPLTVSYAYSTDYVLRVSDIADDFNGGVNKALSAEKGKSLQQDITNLSPERTLVPCWTAATGTWVSGNISSLTPNYGYANKIAFVPVTEDMRISNKFHVEKVSSSFTAEIFLAATKISFLSWLASGTSLDSDYSLVDGANYIAILLWDKPSDAQCIAEDMTVSAVRYGMLQDGDVATSAVQGCVPSQWAYIDIQKQINYVHHTGLHFGAGGMDGSTGALTQTGRITGPIEVKNGDKVYIKHSTPFGRNYICWLYDSTGAAVNEFRIKDEYTPLNISLSTSYGWIRFNIYSVQPNTSVSDADVTACDLHVWIPKLYTVNSYVNPIIVDDAPDPCVWDGEDGYHYMLATGSVSSPKFYRSANLVNWEQVGETPWVQDSISDMTTALGGSYFWAPSVFKVSQNNYVMILTAPSYGHVYLQSANPAYGYEYIKTEPNVAGAPVHYIDAAMARDEEGKLWLFSGDIHIAVRQMSDDGLSYAENSSWTTVASYSSASGNDKLEGVMPFRRNGYWYLFMSSNNYANATYHVVCVRSQSINGPYVNKAGTAATSSGGYTDVLTSYSTSVNPTSQYLYGPGHNAELFVDKNNRTWMLYHSHYYGSSGRGVCLDEIVWDSEGWPTAKILHPSAANECPVI